MSKFHDPASLRVDSPIDSIQVSLVDSSFNEVAHGTGGLEAELRPGIYELRFSAGSSVGSRLINLQAGEKYHEAADLSFPAAIPLRGTSTWNERHQNAAIEASEHAVRTNHGHLGGALVVMARALGDLDPDLDSDPISRPPEFELAEGTTRAGGHDPFDEENPACWRRDGPDWKAMAAAVEPGGYCLRSRSGESTVEQSLWVAPGWQTLAFLPADRDGVVGSRATVVMAPVDRPWDPEFARRTAQATELALAGLRERRTVLPPNFLDLLLRGKFTDPMLGVLGAHSMLLSPSMDLELFDVVLGNLTRLLPGMPDVAALQVLGDEARLGLGRPERLEMVEDLRLEWPPMLLVGYTALIRLDAKRTGAVIVPESPAQSVAGRLIGDGIWTAWSTAAPIAGPRRRQRARAWWRRDSAVGDALRKLEMPEPTTQLVADYLAQVADAEGAESLEGMLAEELGLAANVAAATNVPLRSVHEAIGALRQLKEDI
jgi:hypothetical protein